MRQAQMQQGIFAIASACAGESRRWSNAVWVLKGRSALVAVIHGSSCREIDVLIQGVFAAEVEKSVELNAVQSVT